MQNITPAKLGLFLTAALALTACGGNSTPKPTPTPTEQAGLIKGQITPWPAGKTATVKPEELAVSAPVAADGKFSLGLPNAQIMTTTYNELLFSVADFFGGTAGGICTISNNTAPTDLQLYGISKLEVNTTPSRTIAAINSSKANYTAKLWMFASKDATFTFTGTCLGQGDINETFTLKKGWNVFDVEYLIPSDNTVRTDYTATAQPTTYIPWTDASGNMNSQSLKNNLLEPWKNSAAYQARH